MMEKLMNNENRTKVVKTGGIRRRLRKIMKCLQPEAQLDTVKDMNASSESLATKDYSVSVYSSHATAETEKKKDTGNIEEAELSLRESGSLNYEEARALLGRFEYQKGNIEAALHVFEGIDIAAVIPKMKITLAKTVESRSRRSSKYATNPMSIHAVSLLLEAIFLKAKSLQSFGRYKEAAQSCKVILDVVESSFPKGLPENIGGDRKLYEIVNKAVELLPGLWKQAESPQETILSFRQALLHRWNLDPETTAKIQKDFAIYLLYSGAEANPPNLRSQIEGSFVPKSTLEEAVLLLMILLKKISLKRIEWDPSILDHLSFALSISGGLGALANQLEELLPGVIHRKERDLTLALCYHGEGDDLSALNLLKKIFRCDDKNCVPALLVASKVCGESPEHVEEGVNLSRRAIQILLGGCDRMVGLANYLLGNSLSLQSRLSLTNSDRVKRQSEALECLEASGRMTSLNDPKIVFRLSLENAEQRKLDTALDYSKKFINLEGGCNVKGWLLLARILSAQKRFLDGESIINAALEQTGKWDQGDLLRTKAKLQIAQGQVKNAIGTYTELLALLQVRNKSFGYGKSPLEVAGNLYKSLEVDTWHDLAAVYINMSLWGDAEACLSNSEAISYYSVSRWHTTGLLHEAKGQLKEALSAYEQALSIEPTHVPSLVSIATVLRQLGGGSFAIVRSFLTEALRLDSMNTSAWYNLGLLYKDEGPAYAMEAVDCFEAASILKETEPVEPFR